MLSLLQWRRIIVVIVERANILRWKIVITSFVVLEVPSIVICRRSVHDDKIIAHDSSIAVAQSRRLIDDVIISYSYPVGSGAYRRNSSLSRFSGGAWFCAASDSVSTSSPR